MFHGHGILDDHLGEDGGCFCDQEEQLARLQDAVVRNETKIGNDDTEGTLSHTVAQLKVSKLDLLGIDDRLGGLLRTATGTLPDLVRQDIAVARFRWSGREPQIGQES